MDSVLMDPTKGFYSDGSHERILYYWIPRKDSVAPARMRHGTGALSAPHPQGCGTAPAHFRPRILKDAGHASSRMRHGTGALSAPHPASRRWTDGGPAAEPRGGRRRPLVGSYKGFLLDSYMGFLLLGFLFLPLLEPI